VLALVAFIGMLGSGILPVGFGMHDNVSQTDGLALNGYDVVTYFEGEPLMGYPEFTSEYAGATWQFHLLKHKEFFDAAPETFLPEFGGHCSLAMSTGFAVEGEPTSYEIINDKLYIFSEDGVKATFMEDVDASIKACNANWK